MSTSSSGIAPASSEAEQFVLDCMASERVADFTERPLGQRLVTGPFLAALIAGSKRDGVERSRGALRIRGAEIIGPMCPQADRGFSTLLFWSCSFDGPVDLSGGDYAALRFVDCEMPAFIGASLTTKADLDLAGSRFSGVSDYESELSEVGSCAIHLSNARIGGRLVLSSTPESLFAAQGIVRLEGARIDGSVSCDGASLDGRGDSALNARSMIVGGNVSLGMAAERRFEAVGEVALAAARITGDLSLSGARIVNPDGRALHCEDLRVESVFLMSRNATMFEAHGRLNFLSAIVGGSFIVRGARIAPGPDTERLGTGGPVALNLQQVRLSNELVLSDVAALETDAAVSGRVRGWFLLTGARLSGVFDDIETGWPAPGWLDLEGATYERLRGARSADMLSQRIAWLRLQFPNGRPSADRFRPQPYEELSRVLRRHGQAREADAVAVEKIRMRLAARVDPAWARMLPSLLMLISHHGYSSSRAVISFLLFVAFGTVMYSVALWGFGEPFVPFEFSPEPVQYVLPFELARISVERGCPGLDVLQYALDTALPVINLGQDTYCRFAPQGTWRWLWLLLHAVYTLAGTALSAVVVLTLTGVLRRD